MSDKNLPEDVSNKSIDTLTSVFGQDVSSLSFEDSAKFNALMQVVGKVAKKKRSETRDKLENGLATGDVDGLELQDVGEHSVGAVIPGINISRMEKTKSKFDNDKAVEVLREEGVDFKQAENFGLVDKQVDVDLEGLLAHLDSKGIDYSQFVESVDYDVDEDTFETLKSNGEISEEQFDSCFEKRAYTRFKCTFSSDIKDQVESKLRGELQSEDSGDKQIEASDDAEMTKERLQEVDGVGEELAGRIMSQVG